MKTSHIKFFPILITLWTSVQSQTISNVIALIREAKITKAKTQLKQIEKDTHPETLLFLKGLLSTNGDTAAACYKHLLQSYPTSPYSDDALYRLAQLNYTKGLYKTAKNQFSQLLKTYTKSPLHQKSTFWIDLCDQATGQSDSTTPQFQKISEHSPHTELIIIPQNDLHKQKSPPKPETHYSVQIGAFTNQKNATHRKSFFEKQGYPVDLKTKVKNGQTFYLVQVGTCSTKKQAKKLGEQLKKMYGVKYYLVYE